MGKHHFEWVAIISAVVVPFCILVLTGILEIFLVVWYIDEWYSELTGDNGFLAGIHWIIFYGTVVVTQILWLIVRGIVAIVKAIRRKNEGSEQKY